MDNLSSTAQARDDGKKEGRQEGLAEGLEKGKEEGEHNAKIATARNMLSKGLDIELVSQCTGLTIEEIKVLL